ncbi:penicillin-binding protein [Alteribacter lacisalsi]|uniref:Penicillin-binding protein n=1 Tax=Alteribacter lacisalsi TaxID=2045244 RepID=A0A2W0H704_9BACI|nr:serine hydrolase domain-containing protein [Alteribacter lacisalsi]PYZ97634.1 penicillin-binding protein [Alteribacter lacisalsi]
MLKNKIKHICMKTGFSGVIYAKNNDVALIEQAFGYADRPEKRKNRMNTRFGIASGCKLFTAIAICRLVEEGHLSFGTRLTDCLKNEFPHFDPAITVHHLLTHTSGVPDYFDEAMMDDFEDLWKMQPMYHLRTPRDFLPLFQNQKMMFAPGERFHYNNAGYILLGLIVEAHSGMSFDQFVEKEVFKPCSMHDSGYFSFDRLPGNTAIGYIDEENGSWRTNQYALPVKGGPDGGAFVTAGDMIKLWDSLLSLRLLSKKMTRTLMSPHTETGEGDYYGYGMWIGNRNGEIGIYHVMGYDPGVSFASAYYPAAEVTAVIPSNQSSGPHNILRILETEIL